MHCKDILFLLLLIYITSDTQNSNVFREGIPKARGYPNHHDSTWNKLTEIPKSWMSCEQASFGAVNWDVRVRLIKESRLGYLFYFYGFFFGLI